MCVCDRPYLIRSMYIPCLRSSSAPFRLVLCWTGLVQVKVGRYFLEQLIADLDSSKESSSTIRQRLGNPTALGNFLQLCHLRLLHERDVSLPLLCSYLSLCPTVLKVDSAGVVVVDHVCVYFDFGRKTSTLDGELVRFPCSFQRIMPHVFPSATFLPHLACALKEKNTTLWVGTYRLNAALLSPPPRLPPQASSLELVFDTMTCLFQHLGSRAVPMLPFLGSVLHMLTYSLPAILGPVGAAEESPLDTDDEDSEKDVDGGLSGAGPEPKSGAQATATYYAAVQVLKPETWTSVCVCWRGGVMGVNGRAPFFWHAIFRDEDGFVTVREDMPRGVAGRVIRSTCWWWAEVKRFCLHPCCSRCSCCSPPHISSDRT